MTIEEMKVRKQQAEDGCLFSIRDFEKVRRAIKMATEG